MEPTKRKNIRLPKYDYTQNGGYFITICTHEKQKTLCRIVSGEEGSCLDHILSQWGGTVKRVLEELPTTYGFRLDSYVIMPNHIHMILVKESGESDKTIGELIGAIKSLAANRWYRLCDSKGTTAGKLWQRNYYDHILRGEEDYLEKRKYIEENPVKWHLDELYTV